LVNGFDKRIMSKSALPLDGGGKGWG